MARPEQVLLLEPQHELKFRGKRGGPGFDGRGGAASASGVMWGGGEDRASFTIPGRSRTRHFDVFFTQVGRETALLGKDVRSTDSSAAS